MNIVSMAQVPHTRQPHACPVVRRVCPVEGGSAGEFLTQSNPSGPVVVKSSVLRIVWCTHLVHIYQLKKILLLLQTL